MPSVHLLTSEFKDGLPLVCAVCGEPCTFRVKHTFSWHPPGPTGFNGLALGAAIDLVRTQRVSGEIPLCQKHRRHFFWRFLIPIFCFLGAVGFGVVGLIVINQSESDKPGTLPPSVYLGLTFLVLVIGSGLVGSYCRWSGIHPIRIDKVGVTIERAHERFIRAVEEKRWRESPEVEPMA